MVVQLHTIEEFEQFIALPENADRRFELIAGEIVEKMPTEEHAILALRIGTAIANYLEAYPIGRAGVEARHRLDEHNSYIPDVFFTNNERAKPVVKKGAITQMPDLAVEIASPDDRRLRLRHKALAYLELGSRMVWLVFPDKQQVEVYTADNIHTLEVDDTLDGGDVLPGFTLAIGRIFV